MAPARGERPVPRLLPAVDAEYDARGNSSTLHEVCLSGALLDRARYSMPLREHATLVAEIEDPKAPPKAQGDWGRGQDWVTGTESGTEPRAPSRTGAQSHAQTAVGRKRGGS